MSLVLAELLYDLPSDSTATMLEPSIPNESLFLMGSSDLCYGDFIIYLQTQTFQPNTSRYKQWRIRYQAKYYLIVGNTLYRRGVDTILRRCLTHEEAEKALNGCHAGAFGGHLSGYATAQNILRIGYFWPTIFRDCILIVRSCHACQIFDRKIHKLPAPMHHVVSAGPFT